MNAAIQPQVNREPAFADAASCRRWLAMQPLANPVQMQSALYGQLRLLEQATLSAKERLKILETLRETLGFVQSECARRFIGRALPLLEEERAAFDANRALWGATYDAYRQCLHAFADGDSSLQDLAGRAARRALAVLASEQFESHQARYESDTWFWQRLHAIFATAERAGAADKRLCGIYALPLLMHAASPFTLSQRQMQLLQRWLPRLALKVSVSDKAPWSDHPPLAVGLDSGRPAALSGSGKNLRWLDVSSLARSVKRRLVALQRGQMPAALELGEGCSAAECEVVLRLLYTRCCKGQPERATPRQDCAKSCEVFVGVAAIHDRLSAQGLRPPVGRSKLSAKQLQSIALFGHACVQDNMAPPRESIAAVERWDIADESRDGLRLVRPASLARTRLESGSLLAIRRDDAESMIIGFVRWVMIRTDAKLHVGVTTLPGIPEPAAVRMQARGTGDSAYEQGLLLPEVEVLGLRATVLVPANWFQEGAVLELRGVRPSRVHLTRLSQRGVGFDRAEYLAL